HSLQIPISRNLCARSGTVYKVKILATWITPMLIPSRSTPANRTVNRSRHPFTASIISSAPDNLLLIEVRPLPDPDDLCIDHGRHLNVIPKSVEDRNDARVLLVIGGIHLDGNRFDILLNTRDKRHLVDKIARRLRQELSQDIVVVVFREHLRQ